MYYIAHNFATVMQNHIFQFNKLQYYYVECRRHTRLQNSRIFGERKRHGKIIFKRKVWSECRNGEGEWGETRKNTTIRFVQNYPFFQQREIPIGLILTQPVIKCLSHLIKKISTPYQFHSKTVTSRENGLCGLGMKNARLSISSVLHKSQVLIFLGLFNTISLDTV